MNELFPRSACLIRDPGIQTGSRASVTRCPAVVKARLRETVNAAFASVPSRALASVPSRALASATETDGR